MYDRPSGVVLGVRLHQRRALRVLPAESVCNCKILVRVRISGSFLLRWSIPMSERAYTVREVDQLRMACEARYLYGTSCPVFSGNGTGSSRPYREDVKAACVEQMVRTYMSAGITAADIYKEDQPPLDGGKG